MKIIINNNTENNIIYTYNENNYTYKVEYLTIDREIRDISQE